MTHIARLFRNGGSQAVRLTGECRFDAEEVCIKRIGAAVLLFPKNAAWDLMGEAIGQADDDFLADRDPPEHADKRKTP